LAGSVRLMKPLQGNDGVNTGFPALLRRPMVKTIP
jgi:hypothetical protein